MKNRKTSEIIYYIALFLYMALCLYLYINQLKYPVTGRFEADTPVHVCMAVDDGFYYSLTAFVFLLLSFLPFSDLLIALFLSICTCLSVVMCVRLTKDVAEAYDLKVKEGYIYIFSFCANFVMGFYVKAFNVQHYIGYQNANMWHNSTYIVMRLFALWCLILYLDIYKDSKLNIKKLILFCAVLTLSTAVKPSFFTVFAPVMAIELLWDLFKKKKPFKDVFFFALTVVPSFAVLILQSLVLFGDDTGNGYAISPFTALSQRGDHPKVTLVLSVLFPLLVFITHIKEAFKDRIYAFSLLVWLFGFIEVFFFLETGTRTGDSNFFWGYSIALFVLFFESGILILKDIFKKKIFEETAVLPKVYITALCAIYLWHVISGIRYFVLLLEGLTYFV